MSTVSRAELGIDGNAGFALLGEDLAIGEAEFETITGDHPKGTSEYDRQAKLAINRAFTRLKKRLGGEYRGKPISYFLSDSYPRGSGA
jgi:hypothetical protein